MCSWKISPYWNREALCSFLFFPSIKILTYSSTQKHSTVELLLYTASAVLWPTHTQPHCLQRTWNATDSLKKLYTWWRSEEDSLMLHLDPEVHHIKRQLPSANTCFMMISKKKWLVVDHSETLPLKSFRSQPLQKTLMPNTLILGPGNMGLPGSTWPGSHYNPICVL